MSETTAELISKVTEFNDISEFMQDEDLDKALAAIVDLIINADHLSVKAPILIVRLQAISAKMGLLSQYYTTLQKGAAGTENYKKKNVYYSARENIDKLVDALKYLVRYN